MPLPFFIFRIGIYNQIFYQIKVQRDFYNLRYCTNLGIRFANCNVLSICNILLNIGWEQNYEYRLENRVRTFFFPEL